MEKHYWVLHQAQSSITRHEQRRSISSVGLERGANNAKVLGSTPILTRDRSFAPANTPAVLEAHLSFGPKLNDWLVLATSLNNCWRRNT
jgi:hypothetical protein